jgi:hypothetical protein
MLTFIFSAREADVADNANKSPSGNQYPKTLSPDTIQLLNEHFVVTNLAELVIVVPIFFECPIRRRGNKLPKCGGSRAA